MMIIGHEQVFGWFAQSVRNGRLSHAYLFAGPRHVGKATVARSLAERIACTQHNLAEPACGACDGCAAFATDWCTIAPSNEGNESVKLAEIGIREARVLRRFLGVRPFGRYRAALVDDAEQLTPEAANTLLKVLEEPSAPALLFVVCHEPSRLLETIRSRLVAVSFGLVPLAQSVAGLQAAGASPAEAERFSRRSGGRVGLALTWLTQKSGGADGAAFFHAVLAERNPAKRRQALAAIAEEPAERIREFLNSAELACRDALLASLNLPHRMLEPNEQKTLAPHGPTGLARLAVAIGTLRSRLSESALNAKVAFDALGTMLP